MIGHDGKQSAGSRAIVHKPDSLVEIAFGLGWLSMGAVISSLLEVVYLGSRVSLPGGNIIPLPYTIAIAFGFNLVLSRTSRLWSDRLLLAAIPLLFWLAGCIFLVFGGTTLGGQFAPLDVRIVGLVFAGLAGGGFPLRACK